MEYSVTWGEGFQDNAPRSDLTVLEESKAWFPPENSAAPMNWWQFGARRFNPSAEQFNPVYACRKVIAEEVSRLPAIHYSLDEAGGRTIERSQLSRILRYPNNWQSRVDFWLNMVDELLRDGNAYALAGRDNRGGIGSINSLTQLQNAHPYIDYDTGLVFYGIGIDSTLPLPKAEELDPKRLIPASEVLHLRLFTPTHPLIGEPPLVAARVSADTGTAISNSTFQFFNRAARPSGYLRHPRRISQVVRDRLKKQWGDNYSGSGTGGTAVLEEGLEWQPMSMSAVDAEIVDQYKLTIEDVARVYRVPLFMLGSMDKATFNNVEQMLRSFIAGGLGFYLELIEEGLARFFGLPMNEFVHFDVEGGYLRAEFKDRVEGTVRGIQGGLFTVNEGRRREGLPPKEHGDEPLVQQQMVPLTYASEQTVVDPEPAPPSPPTDDEPVEEGISSQEITQQIRRRLKVAA